MLSPTAEVITRSQAKSIGAKRYFTGKPCLSGHISERLVSTKACIECDKARSIAWKSSNAEHIKAYNSGLYKGKKDEILARQRRYREQNKDKIAAYSKSRATKTAERSKAWRIENNERASEYTARYRSEKRDVVNSKEARRRARALQATPPWSDSEQIRLVYQEAARLQAEDGVARHVDHIVPLQGRLVCGLHVSWNLRVMTATENLKKANKHDMGSTS